MTDAEIIDDLARSLAEFDGYVIVEKHPATVGGWELRAEPDTPIRPREDYEREAARFLHLFRAVMQNAWRQMGALPRKEPKKAIS